MPQRQGRFFVIEQAKAIFSFATLGQVLVTESEASIDYGDVKVSSKLHFCQVL